MDYEPTKKIRQADAPAPADFTRLIRKGGQPNSPGGSQPGETRMIGRQTKGADNDDGRTVLYRPNKPTRRTETTSGESPKTSPEDSGSAQPLRGPVAAWLAIVSGPGEGDFVWLGYGMNTIGRDEDQRCRLDFGDQKISRKSHASLTYDPENRKFYIQHGGGQNLTYLGSQPVLAPLELKGGEFIRMGETVLRFVPLCGPDFEYGEHSKG